MPNTVCEDFRGYICKFKLYENTFTIILYLHLRLNLKFNNLLFRITFPLITPSTKKLAITCVTLVLNSDNICLTPSDWSAMLQQRKMTYKFTNTLSVVLIQIENECCIFLKSLLFLPNVDFFTNFYYITLILAIFKLFTHRNISISEGL